MFNWLTQFFSTRRSTLQRTPRHIEAVAVHNNTLSSTEYTQQQHATMYQQASWVHVAVSRIAEAGALVPLKVLAMNGERTREIERHPLEILLDNPNPTMSRFELLESTLGFLELTGNAYWYLAGDAKGRPAEIWVLRPDRVTIVPHPTDYVAGYLYHVDGKQIPLDALEVVHFKRWHPANDYYGLSPLEAARLAVESDRAMAQWNQNTFGQGHGVPAGIVNITDFVSDADFERIKREWRTSYGRGQRKTAFLRGGTVTWNNIGLSHTDLDFLQGRLAHRDEILTIFGIPMGLVSENATEANATVAERQFIERTLYPKLVRIAQKITQELLPFYDDNLVALFDDIRPTDTQARLDEIRTAQSVLSINEIRQQFYNLPSVTWGNLPLGMASDDIEKDTQDETDTASVDDSEEQNNATAPDVKAIQTELAQWERFALNRLGKTQVRPFEVTAVPDDIAFEISAGLLFAPDAESVKAVFREVVGCLQEPVNG